MPGPVLAIHQQNVRVPVIVVINKRAARPHSLRQPLLSEGAIVVREFNPGLHGNIAESLLRVGGDRQKQNPAQRRRDTEARRAAATLRLFSVTLWLCGGMDFCGLHYFEPPASAAGTASPMRFGLCSGSATDTCS